MKNLVPPKIALVVDIVKAVASRLVNIQRQTTVRLK